MAGSPVGWGRGPTFAAVADTTEAAAGGWAGGPAIIAIGMSEHTVQYSFGGTMHIPRQI